MLPHLKRCFETSSLSLPRPPHHRSTTRCQAHGTSLHTTSGTALPRLTRQSSSRLLSLVHSSSLPCTSHTFLSQCTSRRAREKGSPSTSRRPLGTLLRATSSRAQGRNGASVRNGSSRRDREGSTTTEGGYPSMGSRLRSRPSSVALHRTLVPACEVRMVLGSVRSCSQRSRLEVSED